MTDAGSNKLNGGLDVVLRDRIVESLLGRPLVNNAFRGTLVEAILAGALEYPWRWCADGWGSFDFERSDGLGLEVKQSAALQDWHAEGARPNPGRFDIAARTGRYETDGGWTVAPGRAAAIYVFAWHPVVDRAFADHRDARQWEFYAVLAHDLPVQKSIGLAAVRALSSAVAIDRVADAVKELSEC